MLKQAHGRINAISSGSVYDTKKYYQTIHIKRIVSRIPPIK
ncbi:hypothetical protein [Candidatus Enterovibrio altilux]